MKKIISGIFDSYDYASNACQEIRNSGIASGEISLITRNDFDEGSVGYASGIVENASDIGQSTGFMFDLKSIAVPGMGIVGSVGPASSVMTDPSSGSVISAIMDLGIHEPSAYRYEKQLNEGRVLFSMPINADTSGKVAKILRTGGAKSIEIHNS